MTGGVERASGGGYAKGGGSTSAVCQGATTGLPFHADCGACATGVGPEGLGGPEMPSKQAHWIGISVAFHTLP